MLTVVIYLALIVMRSMLSRYSESLKRVELIPQSLVILPLPIELYTTLLQETYDRWAHDMTGKTSSVTILLLLLLCLLP